MSTCIHVHTYILRSFSHIHEGSFQNSGVYMCVCTLSTYIIYLCMDKQLTHSIKLKVSNFYKNYYMAAVDVLAWP